MSEPEKVFKLLRTRHSGKPLPRICSNLFPIYSIQRALSINKRSQLTWGVEIRLSGHVSDLYNFTRIPVPTSPTLSLDLLYLSPRLNTQALLRLQRLTLSANVCPRRVYLSSPDAR